MAQRSLSLSLAAVAVAAAWRSLAFIPSVHALGTNYVHDGATTYCWHIPQPTTNTKLNDSDRVVGFSGADGCPMGMTVELSASPVEPFQSVNVTWTVSADFRGANEVNMTTVSYGDDAKGDPAQIVHSNIHTCIYGTGCDPFNDGKQLIDKTVNRIANLTDNKATFTDAIQFPDTGEYSVLAHIIMPATNTSERFDYAVYIQLNVQDTTPTSTPTPTPTVTAAPVTSVNNKSSEGGLSNAAIIGIIVGGVVLVVALGVIAFIFRRRHSQTPEPTNYAYMPPPPYEAASEICKGSDQFQSDSTAPSMSHSQGAWSGAGGGSIAISGAGAGSHAGGASAGSQHSSQNLDGTGGSNGSHGSYATYDSRVPPPQQQQQYQGGFRPSGGPTGSSMPSGSAQRPRRVDSDVEL